MIGVGGGGSSLFQSEIKWPVTGSVSSFLGPPVLWTQEQTQAQMLHRKDGGFTT